MRINTNYNEPNQFQTKNGVVVSAHKEEGVRSNKGSNENKDNTKDFNTNNKGRIIIRGDQLNLMADKSNINDLKSRREKVKNQALMDQFEKDLDRQQIKEDRITKIQNLSKDKLTYQGEIRNLKEKEASLQESYNVRDDSEEQKQLTILKDLQNSGILTEEKINELSEEGKITKYQKEALSLNGMVKHWQDEINVADKEMNANKNAIKAQQMAELKVCPMVKVKEEVEEVVDSLSNQIQKVIVKDAVEKIDKEVVKKDEKEDTTDLIHLDKEIEEEILKGLKIDEEV